MEGMMTKEQVIESTIGTLSNLRVPVGMKHELADPIEGCMNNLVIVLQMIAAEKQATAEEAARKAQEGQEEAPAAENEPEPGMEPIRLPERREEAAEDGRDTDAE